MKRHTWARFGLSEVPADTAWKLTDALYAQDARLAYSVLLLLMAALLAWVRTRSWWFVAWGSLSLPIAAWRLNGIRAYRRADRSATPLPWVLRSMVGAWLAGALWGAASLVLVLQSDPFVQFLLIVCQTAFVAGGAVRNSSIPRVAQGQTLLATLPLVGTALASRLPYYQVFAVFALFNIVTTWTIIRTVHLQSLNLLLADGEKARLLEELMQVNKQLEEMASSDALTRIHNRRGFDVRLSQEWRRAARNATEISLLMLDVDCFKLFNDHYGHQTGDDCLYKVAQGILHASRRPADIVCRYGGEEFAVILPATGKEGAIHVADRIREALAILAIPHSGLPGGQVTISIGCTTTLPSLGSETVSFIQQADEALFGAKREGRNRVVTYAGPGRWLSDRWHPPADPPVEATENADYERGGMAS